MAFTAASFVDAWRSGRDLKTEVRSGKTSIDKLIKEMEEAVNKQEGFHPSEDQWKEIREELQRVTTEDPKQPQPFQDKTSTRPAAPPPHSGSSDVGAPKPTVTPGPRVSGSTQVEKPPAQKPVADDPKKPETEKQKDK